MLLSTEMAVHQPVPKEYELDLTAEDVKNTFVFTEQDLPGFKSKSQTKFDPASANMPARLTRPAKVEKQKLPYDPDRKYTPFYKKAIPSELGLAFWVQLIDLLRTNYPCRQSKA
jgi:transcription initiation factor TFIIF subunit beta